MSRERYFASSPMDWFRPGPDSRYSPYHWEEMRRQAQHAAQLVLITSREVHNPSIGIVGFGFGRDTAILLDEFRRDGRSDIVSLVGLDINRSRFVEARKEIGEDHFKESVRPLVASMNRIPLDSDSFDATVCLETMVHTDDPHATLTEFIRITKPGGLILFNISISQGRVRDALLVMESEGLKRTLVRVRERFVRTPESFSYRTTLYTPAQLQELLARCNGTELVERRAYYRGISTLIALRKTR